MKKIVFLFFGASLLILSACSSMGIGGGSEPLMSSSKNVDKKTGEGKPIPPNFAQFADIPIPEGAEMDLTKSLVFGSQNKWSGRLVFTAPYSQGGLFDFYVSEMPRFGWKEVTVVRSKSSVLTFSQNDRVATIQLNGDSSSASEVSFTVSPAAVKASSSANGKIKSSSYDY